MQWRIFPPAWRPQVSWGVRSPCASRLGNDTIFSGMTASRLRPFFVLALACVPACSRAQDARLVLRTPSAGMEPTLKAGELVTFATFPDSIVAARTVRHGDLVLFAFRQEPTARFVQRLVGMPGDTLAMQRGRLRRNGQPVPEAYAWFADSSAGAQPYNWGPFVLPPASYFVLGDNRDASRDGRYWGPVPAGLLFGRAVDPESGEPRR
jgi:signal peptidase I